MAYSSEPNVAPLFVTPLPAAKSVKSSASVLQLLQGREKRVPAHLAITLDSGRGQQPLDPGEAERAFDQMALTCLENGVHTLTLVLPSGNDSQPVEQAATRFASLRREPLKLRGIRIRVLNGAAAERSENGAHNVAPMMTINIVTNYDGRSELIHAVRQMAARALDGSLDPAAINAQNFERRLFTHGLPPVDLLVRTGGATRLENYLLWQSAYAELLFLEIHWSRLDREQLQVAFADYAGRCRKFGGLA